MASPTPACLTDWMSQLPECLWDTQLHQLAIPGTHNSFSYSLDPSAIGPDAPDIAKAFGPLASMLGGTFQKWSQTCSQTVEEQLNSGIRYFDMRVASRKGTPDAHFVHGLYGCPVKDVLGQIDDFLTGHPKEVVILDFNHFYEMSEKHHRDLLATLVESFGVKLCLFVGMENLTLRMMWENGLQVIILYHHKVATDFCQVWPGSACIRSLWANTADVRTLVRFLEERHDKARGQHFTVCQGVLTPDVSYILAHMDGSLKTDIAAKATPAVIEWLASKKQADCHRINICTADFTDSVDFPRKVVELNYK